MLFIICLTACGTQSESGVHIDMESPYIPAEMYRIDDIKPAAMDQLKQKVDGLSIEDFLHQQKIADIEKQGFTVSAENIRLVDCNNISFDIVLTKENSAVLRLPVVGVLMYDYRPDADMLYIDPTYINDLHILWGNLNITENDIIFANMDIVHVFNPDTLQQKFRQPDLPFADGDSICFILDVIKSENGYIVAYYSDTKSGFVTLSDSGRIADIYRTGMNSGFAVAFGTARSEIFPGQNYNTNYRARTLLHSFYTEGQMFISCDYVKDLTGPDYYMYDFADNTFSFSDLIARYYIPPFEYEVFAMQPCGNTGTAKKDTTFIAFKKEDGAITHKIVFTADIDIEQFGKDLSSGYMHIALSSGRNNLTLGCRKTNTVINIDYTSQTADVFASDIMPQMFPVVTSAENTYTLYRGWDSYTAPLVVKSVSQRCRVYYLTDVSGWYGTDWLAGFSDNCIYVLTRNDFAVFSWDRTAYWNETFHITGRFNVNTQEVQRLCGLYI